MLPWARQTPQTAGAKLGNKAQNHLNNGKAKQASQSKQRSRRRQKQTRQSWLNPKANLKKRTEVTQSRTIGSVHQKPLPWSQRASKTKGTQNTPRICSFTTKGDGGFEAAIEKGKGGKWGKQQQRCLQELPTNSHQKGPMAKPRGHQKGARISRGRSG